MNEFEVGFSDTPVFRDGLTTDLTYVFLACKSSDQYNGVVYGMNGKLKFYPDAQFWGITQSLLNDLGMGTLYESLDYQGLYSVPRARVPAILERLRTQRGVQTVSDATFEAFDKYTDYSERGRSRQYHPATHWVPSRGSLPANVEPEPAGWPMPVREQQSNPTPQPVAKDESKLAKSPSVPKGDKAKAKEKAAAAKAKEQAKVVAEKSKLKAKLKQAKAKEAQAKEKAKQKAKEVEAKAKLKAKQKSDTP
jgi:hypothetical protein